MLFVFHVLLINVNLFLLLFCENATPNFLLETANCRRFGFFPLVKATVKFVMMKPLHFVFLSCFQTQNKSVFFHFFTVTSITCEL